MTSNEYSNPDILVSTAWLEDHIDEPDIRVVDCDMMDSYARAHIKGSVGIDVHHYIKHPNYPSDNKTYPWVAGPEVVKDIFQRMGIGDETTVVAYDSNGSLWATRFWWVLNYYGHTKVKVLDGGWKKWFDENRPLSIDIPTIKETIFTPEIKLGLICEIDEMSSKLENEATIFLDVRSNSEWDGTNDRGNLRSGRMPGSVHLEWLNFVEADRYQTFKTASELRRMLSDLGVTSEKEVITY